MWDTKPARTGRERRNILQWVEPGNIPVVQPGRVTSAQPLLCTPAPLYHSSKLKTRIQYWRVGVRSEEQGVAGQPPLLLPWPSLQFQGAGGPCRASTPVPRSCPVPASAPLPVQAPLPLPSISTDQVSGGISCQSPFITFKKPRNPEQDKN